MAPVLREGLTVWRGAAQAFQKEFHFSTVHASEGEDGVIVSSQSNIALEYSMYGY